MPGMRPAVRRIALGAAAFALLAGAGWLWLGFGPRKVPEGQPGLATLSAQTLSSFRAAFDADAGKVRILALLSPT